PQNSPGQMLRRRHHPQTQDTRKTKGRQKANEAHRASRYSARSVSGGAEGGRGGIVSSSLGSLQSQNYLQRNPSAAEAAIDFARRTARVEQAAGERRLPANFCRTGAKVRLDLWTTYAALKRRSSTSAHNFVIFPQLSKPWPFKAMMSRQFLMCFRPTSSAREASASARLPHIRNTLNPAFLA